MKKSLIVLLIAVLAMGSVFAADPVITGSATATAKWDFDKETFSYSVAPSFTAYVKWLQTFDKAKKGENGVYVDAAATVSYIPADAQSNGYQTQIGVPSAYNVYSNGFNVSLDKFQIVGEKWTLDLIATLANTDFATDVIDTVKAYNSTYTAADYMPYSYQWTTKAIDDGVYAVAFQYDGLGTVYAVASADAKAKNETQAVETGSFTVMAVSEEKAVNEDIKVQGAVGYSFQYEADKESLFGASVKASYQDIATVASDMGFTKTEDEDAEFDADVQLHVAYEPVTFDAFYATNANLAYSYPYYYGATVDDVEDLLSFQAVVEFEELDTTVTAVASNVVNDEREVGVELVNTSLADHEFTLALADITDEEEIEISFGSEVAVNENLSANFGISSVLAAKNYPVVTAGFAYADDVYAVSLAAEIDANAKEIEDADFADYVDFTFKASYKADLYTASVAAYLDTKPVVTYSTNAKTGVKTKQVKYNAPSQGLILNLNLTSTTLVDGATLALDWTTGRLNYKSFDLKEAEMGALAATCKVTF